MASYKSHILKIKLLGSTKFENSIKRDMARAVKTFIGRRFNSLTGPDGRKWARRKDNLPHRLMDKSGELRKGWKSARVYYTVGGFSVSNTSVKYAGVHQTGRKRKGKMPARKVFPTDGTSPTVVQKEFRKIIRTAQRKVMKK